MKKPNFFSNLNKEAFVRRHENHFYEFDWEHTVDAIFWNFFDVKDDVCMLFFAKTTNFYI